MNTVRDVLIHHHKVQDVNTFGTLFSCSAISKYWDSEYTPCPAPAAGWYEDELPVTECIARLKFINQDNHRQILLSHLLTLFLMMSSNE